MTLKRVHFIVATLLVLAAYTSTANAEPRGVLPNRKPMIVAPMLEGIFLCDQAADNPEIKDMASAVSYCIDHRLDASARISRTLDQLEPGGPKGKVQIGYLATLPLLSLYQRKGNEWVINQNKVDTFIQVLEKVERPVVVYLAADHFDTTGPISDDLAKDPENLMHLANGKAPLAGYFGNKIIPYTLLTDESIPVNHYRFEALRFVAKRIEEMPKSARDRIVAITLAGELHQLFANFETGMGAYKDIQTTDYSPRAIDDFHRWLGHKYGSIQVMNTRTGLPYRTFDEVPTPSKDITKEGLKSSGEDYDALAGGDVPVTGWLWDPEHEISKLDLYVDDTRVGPITYGLGRLDVYRAVPEITSANVGFRYDLDYRSYATGHHVVQVVAESKGAQYLIGQADVVVVPRDQGKVEPLTAKYSANFRDASALPQVRAWLDLPHPLQSLYYNPVARDWNEYRQYQVTKFLAVFYTIARESGLPADKLYSHQIVARANSTWNPQLLGADGILKTGTPWKLGVNMYGGATNSTWMHKLLVEHHATDYGVPEFNPQQWKVPNAAYDALDAQYRWGARFVSPYYISMVPARFKSPMGQELRSMEIGPANKNDGSDQFYRAIREFAKN